MATRRRTRHVWTDQDTLRFISERMEHDHLFTGCRGSAIDGYRVVLRGIGLENIVLNIQAKKKWENLKRVYRELLNPRAGRSTGRLTAATWPFFEAMHEALGHKDVMTAVHTISITGMLESGCDSDHGYHRPSAPEPSSPQAPPSPRAPPSPPAPSTPDPSHPSTPGPTHPSVSTSFSPGPSTQKPVGAKRKANHLDPPDQFRDWMQQQERGQAELDRKQAEQERRQAEQERRQAEQERRQAEQERRQAEQERRQAEQERRQAEQERRQAEQERRRAEQERQQKDTEAEDGRRFDRLLNILDKWAENNK